MSLADIVLRGLVADYNVACNACGTRFRRSGLSVLRRERDVWQVRARCRQCALVSLLVVKVDRSGNELEAEERQRFADAPPISADDVLDMAGFLSTFDGDFRVLFAAGEQPAEVAGDADPAES